MVVKVDMFGEDQIRSDQIRSCIHITITISVVSLENRIIVTYDLSLIAISLPSKPGSNITVNANSDNNLHCPD